MKQLQNPFHTGETLLEEFLEPARINHSLRKRSGGLAHGSMNSLKESQA